MRIFGPLYDRVLKWSRHPLAERYLATLAFAESSFFPVPVDVMLAPMCLANRGRAWRYAIIATIFSVTGGLGGYAIGYGLFEAIEPWLQQSSYWHAYQTCREWFDTYGVWAIFVAGFSPIPYKVFTIAAGVAMLNVPGFFIASLIGRGARFFLVSGLVVLGGDKLEASLRRYVEGVGWVVAVLAIAVIGWLSVRG
jgi:membrane protein YqaA with SNARE-associated domain